MNAYPSLRSSLLAAVGLTLGLNAFALESSEKPPLPLDELRTFTEIFERVKSAYVEEIDDSTLLENAIKGLLSGLDPHSAYLDPKSFNALQVHTTGEFGGLGIEVGMEDGFVRVITPIDDTPAQRAGVKAGDMIIKLDDQAVQGMDLGDAVNLMRGKPGSKIRLTVMRQGESKPRVITVVRDVIKVTSVKSRRLEGDFGYLRITQFQVTTGPDMVAAIEALQAKGALKGVVLDLRNNPGGVLQAAVDVSDAFLNSGLIVYTEGRLQQSELSYSANNTDVLGDLPLVVLINGGSASASEIVAGALQDHHRAIIMGTPSFGKGSVQTILPLTNNRALKLTTARYFTPSGRSIQAQGIAPDILVEPSTLTQLEGRQGLKEANLRGHLSNGNGDGHSNGDDAVKDTPAEPNGDSHAASSEDNRQLLSSDYQLNEALNLLKGLAIQARRSTVGS